MSEIPEGLKATMKKQGYHFVGNHSAVKICEYAANGLEGKELCYKAKFYGIRSWQCMQSTTAIGCDLRCRFCWRIIPEEHGYKWNELNAVEWDDPDYIIDGMIKEQRRIVSGYKAVADTEEKRKRWIEANNPKHATLSLTGEPLFYPKMSDIIGKFHERGMSTFVVHNGTLPEAIKKLKNLPTQFYISLQAPDEETYLKTTLPKIPGAWNKFNESLVLMRSMKTRTVLRMTLVKGLNMTNPEGYAKLIKIAMPNYVEVKGFSFVGGSRDEQRGLALGNMPTHEEIKDFAVKIAEFSNYIYTDEHRTSRIVLLSRDAESVSKRFIDFDKIGR